MKIEALLRENWKIYKIMGSTYKHLRQDTFPVSVLKPGIIYNKKLNLIPDITILNVKQKNEFSIVTKFLHTFWKYNAASAFY